MSVDHVIAIIGPRGTASAIVILVEICTSLIAGYPVLLPTSAGRDAWESCLVLGAVMFFMARRKIPSRHCLGEIIPTLVSVQVHLQNKTSRLSTAKESCA